MAYSRLLNLRVVARDMVMHYTPTLIFSEPDLILVDCGTPGLIGHLSEAFEVEGFNLSDLTKVIITHHDHDHYGSLAELKRLYPKVEVIASTVEAPYIEGLKKSLRLQQAEALYETLPPERKEWADWFHRYLASIEPVKIDRIICYHGGLVEGDIKKALIEISKTS